MVLNGDQYVYLDIYLGKFDTVFWGPMLSKDGNLSNIL